MFCHRTLNIITEGLQFRSYMLINLLNVTHRYLPTHIIIHTSQQIPGFSRFNIFKVYFGKEHVFPNNLLFGSVRMVQRPYSSMFVLIDFHHLLDERGDYGLL